MSQISEISIEKAFYRGHYDKIIQLRGKLTAAESIFLIGAYCFQGQPEEAEALISLNKAPDPRAYFFLGIGWTRLSQYKKAREHFRKLSQNKENQLDLFLLSQGMSFLNYFICRYQHAEKWINRAKKYLKPQEHPFWKLIFLDLSSHIMVRRGRINLGINQARSALELARDINNKFTQEAIEVSLAIYESTYGLNQKDSMVHLEKLMSKYKKGSNFYFFNLSLEYIRRLNLDGNFEKSEKHLRSIEKSIFSSSLRRQKALWSFRWSHLLFLQGRAEQSLNQIEGALEYLDSKQDLSLQLQLLGLKYKILSLQRVEDENLVEEMKKIIFYCQDTQGLSYAYRYGWTNKPVTEDPYAQFFHRWRRSGYKNYQSLKSAMEQGWSSLLVDLVPTNRQHFIYLDFMPKQALLFSDKGISVLPGLTHLIRQSLLVLSRGKTAKKDFVEVIWGYEYDSYRHDVLVYTVVSRLREFLKEHRDLLVMKDHTIELIQTHCRVYEHESEISVAPAALQHSHLNYRQIEILEFLAKNKYIDADGVSKILHTSRITAFRDLDGLVKLNKICRLGRGRATRYALITGTA